ncbi:MAG: hypothetical protein KDJ16_01200, partial [Hyphomicrobiales bacterium]|nr:hypothetical protein [Hyphomicrobiales bacterium]
DAARGAGDDRGAAVEGEGVCVHGSCSRIKSVLRYRFSYLGACGLVCQSDRAVCAAFYTIIDLPVRQAQTGMEA